jgi:hypothetical protein
MGMTNDNNTNDRISPEALQASLDRRLAALRETPAIIMPDRKARRLPPRNRRTSVPHRSIR